MSSLKLLNDLAINADKDSRTDGLGFITYAGVLGDAALETQGPFTIGVFGEWGTGKTSLMQLIQSYLNEKEDVVTVWFNAWRYEKEEHPIVPLLATIIREIQLNRTFMQSLKDQGRELLNSLRAVAYGFSSKSTVKIPGLAEIEASFVAKEMVDRAESLSNDPLLGRSLYYEAFERLSATKIGNDKKIVVFIDDLDRCFPDLAIKLLESIKLVLSQSGFVFVIGVARTVIEGYLQHRYQKEYGLENFEGEFYLDKIVQLSFHIPPHQDRIAQFCTSLLKQLAPEDNDVFSAILPTIAKTTGGNPRATIRFVNNLLINRAINHSLAEVGEMESIPIEYFSVTRLLQQRWHDVFSMIITSPNLATDITTWKKDDLSKYSKSDDKDVANLATKLLTDKLLAELLLSPYGKPWLTDENIRNSTIGFLKNRTQEAESYREHLERKYDLFISYARKDRPYVEDIINRLSELNISVFYDYEYMLPGMDWKYEIEKAIDNSKGILFCIGRNASTVKNKAMPKEIQLVLNAMKSSNSLRVIPVLLPGMTIDRVPEEFLSYQFLDMSEGITDEKMLQITRVISIW